MSIRDDGSIAPGGGEEGDNREVSVLSYGHAAVAQGNAALAAYAPVSKPGQRAKTRTSKTPSSKKQIRAILSDLKKLYGERYRKHQAENYFKKKVDLSVIPPKDWPKILLEDADRLSKWHEQKSLKFFAPEIDTKLRKKYSTPEDEKKKYGSLKKPYPYEEMSEKTKLRYEDRIYLFGHIHRSIVQEVNQNASSILGFYSPPQNKIHINESHVTHGILAHELGHAYAHPRWQDGMSILYWHDLTNVNKQQEGLVSRIARDVTVEYSHQRNTIIPFYGYGGKYEKFTKELVNKVGQDRLYDAYFGGYIEIPDYDNPKDGILLGKDKKQIKWPWP